MEFSQEFKVPADIHHLILSEHLVALIDNQTSIRFVDPGTGKPLKQQLFEIPLEYSYFRGNSSSSDGQLLCLYFPQAIKTFLYEYNTAQMEYVQKAPLAWCEAATEVSAFSEDGTLLAAGGNDGRVCIYRTDTAKLVTIAPRHNEYISSLAFNADGSMIGYSSFKKQLTIFDLARNSVLSGYSYKEVIGCMGFLHRASFLVLGARDNKVLLYDVINGYLVRELITTVNWPMAIYVDKEDQFCFVSDKAGYLYLIDLSVAEPDNEPVFNSKSVIVDIKRRGEAIYFAFEDGRVTILDMGAEREKFMTSIQNRDMSAMYQMMQDNPILKFSASGIVGNLDETFNERFTKAVLLIAQGKNDLAKEAMGDLLDYPTYQKRFEGTVRHASKVITFWQLIQSGQYMEAYNMANEGDFYRKLPLFKLLEDRFVERFKEAVKNLNGPQPDAKKAREDLLLFLKVPSKDAVIKAMFRSPEIFNKAQNAFDRKDWPELSNLIEKFKMLRGAPAVTAYQEMIKAQEERFLALMASGRFEEAFEPARFLKENAKNELVALKIEFGRLEVVERFIETVKNKQYGTAMQMALEHPFLITSSAYKALDQMLSVRFKAAHLYATRNQFEPMDKLVRPFLKNPFSKNRAMGIYKTIYLEQIAAVGAKMQQKHWINCLKNYVARFGVDNEIELMLRRFDQEKLLEMFAEFKGSNFFRYPLIPNVVTTPFAKPAAKPGG